MFGLWTRLWAVPYCSRHIRITGSHAADTNAPYNMLTHNKRGYGFLNVYMRYTYTFLIHSLFWFVMHIITSQSPGVLHVPACNHDRPPLPGFTFFEHALFIVWSNYGCAYCHPEAALSLVQVIYVMASYRTYGGSKLINEAILYFCELTISCKYESIPYLLYTRKPDMDEYTR